MPARYGAAALTAALTLILTSPAALTQEGAREWTPDLILQVKRVGPVQVSPDGTRAAFVVSRTVMEGEKSDWLSQIHLANADGSGAFQLTYGEKSSTQPQWSPDGRWIGFISARTGKGNVFRIRLDGGEAEQLTDEQGNVSTFRWSPDGKSIAFLMTDPKTGEEEKADKEKRDAVVVDGQFKYARIYISPVEEDEAGKRPSRKLTTEAMHVLHARWSPDGKSLVFDHSRTPKVFDPNDVSVVDVASGQVRAIAATPAHEHGAVFSRDGARIAFVASDNPPTWGFTGWVQVIDVKGGAPRALAKTFDEQPSIAGWSADGSRLYVHETHGAAGGRLSALPIDGGAPVEVSPADLGLDNPNLNLTGTAVGFTSMQPDRAPEPFVSRLDRFSPVQVARVQELPSPEQAPVGRTDVITWKSPDGMRIEGLLSYPVGYEKGTRVPLLVIVHGGPAGVYTRSFAGNPGPYPMAVFTARGYALLRVNPRGSSGYGRKFRYANYQDWGGGDYRDIMSGVDHAISLGVADPERLGVMGWSYGGFMTSWIITQTKRFKAASVGAGVTNLMSFTGTADIPGFVPDYFGGEFWDVFDRWRAHSAMFNIKGVTTPTLIQHGEKDERVPVTQGYELYNALVRQNVPTKMVVYPRQPHGIQEPKLIKDAMERNLEWFDRWIQTKGATSSAP